MKKCIAFDIDRTIVDSYQSELLSLQEAIENITGRKMTEDQMKKLTALPTSDFFKYINLNEEEIILVNKEWENTFSKYKTICFPKIKEIIQELYNKGFLIGVITSRTMSEFHELDNELSDILHCFKTIVTSDLIQKPKPNKESMDYLCKELQVKPEEIIYVGDNENDKIFSENCKVDFIPACWENKELEQEKNACMTTEELLTIIKNFK